jgi:hypothetical protein
MHTLKGSAALSSKRKRTRHVDADNEEPKDSHAAGFFRIRHQKRIEKSVRTETEAITRRRDNGKMANQEHNFRHFMEQSLSLHRTPQRGQHARTEIR